MAFTASKSSSRKIRLLNNPITASIITIAVLLFWGSLYITITRSSKTTEHLTTLENENESLQKEVDDINQRFVNAKDPFTKETLIRNEILLQKEGEYVVMIPEVLAENQPALDSITQEKTPFEEWLALLSN